MKTIGMLGGMSWESSTVLSPGGIEALQSAGRWDETTACLAIVGRRLAIGDADFVMIGCTEIPILAKREDAAVPLFDTTMLRALAAVELALRRSFFGLLFVIAFHGLLVWVCS